CNREAGCVDRDGSSRAGYGRSAGRGRVESEGITGSRCLDVAGGISRAGTNRVGAIRQVEPGRQTGRLGPTGAVARGEPDFAAGPCRAVPEGSVRVSLQADLDGLNGAGRSITSCPGNGRKGVDAYSAGRRGDCRCWRGYVPGDRIVSARRGGVAVTSQ